MPSLFVIRGNNQGNRYELDEQIVRLGRDASNTVELNDTEISRRHAEIRHAEGVYTLSDLDSSNGTFVNGLRVDRHRLASGDQIQAGGTLLLFTQPVRETSDLSSQVRIASGPRASDQSRIIHSVSHEEGSRIFEPRTDVKHSSWLAGARSNLQVMYRIALAVSYTLDIDELLRRIMELIFEWVEADRGCVMLLDAETKSLEPKARRTRRGVESEEKIIISQTILDYVMQRKEGVLTSDARQDQRWDPAASIVQAGIREAICVPMQGRYDVVGVIYIDTSTPPDEVIRRGHGDKFTEDHLKLMIAIAHQAALAVEDTRYRSAMIQAERLAAVGQTIATLSHHIKNILQGIRGGSYLIEMGLSKHDEDIVSKGWTIVEKNQGKISNLVMDMLTFSKEREPELLPSDMNEVVGDVIELMQTRAEELEVALEWRAAEAMPRFVFDPEGLHRAVLNVVTNALDAASERETAGLVEVTVLHAADERKLRVIVKDNGPGMETKHLENVFSPFVSFKGGRGTGLGLPVSQKILIEHGGQIVVESQPSQGSRFTLELPAVSPDAGQVTRVE